MAVTTTVINATDWIFQVSEDSGSTYDTVGKLTNVDFSWSMAEREITTKDSSGWKEMLPGKMEASASFEALTLFDTSADVDRPNDVFTLASGRSSLDIRIGKINTGDYVYTGSGYFVDFGYGAGVEDNVTNSVGFTFTGAVTQAVMS